MKSWRAIVDMLIEEIEARDRMITRLGLTPPTVYELESEEKPDRKIIPFDGSDPYHGPGDQGGGR